MIKSKKGDGGPETMIEVIGIILAVVLALIFLNYCTSITASFLKTQESKEKFIDALIDVAQNHQTGGGKPISLDIDPNSAIIGFNPGQDFIFEKTKRSSYQMVTRLKPVKASRFEDCKDDKLTCICACYGFSVEVDSNGEHFVDCAKAECSETDQVVFPSKTIMSMIFDPVEEPNYDSYFSWNDGIILLRHPDYSMRDLYVGDRPEYLYTHNIDSMSMFIQKIGSPNTVGLCFKDECFDYVEPIEPDPIEPCKYWTCDEIYNEDDCINIQILEGCEGFPFECRYDEKLEKCWAVT